MEFQYKEKTKQMFENIKKSIPKFSDIRDISCETITEHITNKIAKEYDEFLLNEFEKRGYTLEELKGGRHKLNKYIKPIGDGEEIHQYFVDDNCVLEISIKDKIISENF